MQNALINYVEMFDIDRSKNEKKRKELTRLKYIYAYMHDSRLHSICMNWEAYCIGY